MIAQEMTTLLKLSKIELYNHIMLFLDDAEISVIEGDNYLVTNLYPNEEVPLICVHIDTISDTTPTDEDMDVIGDMISLKPESKLRCLGGDDRAGVWIALKMLEEGTSSKFEYGFFDLEERGAIGAAEYADTNPKHSCYIGLDRGTQGKKEVATYGMDCQELIDIFLELGYTKARGTFTDCSVLAEAAGKPCVNISVGYSMEHSPGEFIDLEMTQEALQDMLAVRVWGVYDVELKPMPGFDSGYEAVVCDRCGYHGPLYMMNSGIYVCELCLENKLIGLD